MSGEIYNIAKRAVNAYINTGSIPHYVATQVERDVQTWAKRQILEAKAQALEEAANDQINEGHRTWLRTRAAAVRGEI